MVAGRETGDACDAWHDGSSSNEHRSRRVSWLTTRNADARFDIVRPFADIHRQFGTGLRSDEHTTQVAAFGPNLIDVEVPSVSKLLVDEVRVCAPCWPRGGRVQARFGGGGGGGGERTSCWVRSQRYIVSPTVTFLPRSRSLCVCVFLSCSESVCVLGSPSVLPVPSVQLCLVVLGRVLLLLCRDPADHYHLAHRGAGQHAPQLAESPRNGQPGSAGDRVSQ